MTRDLKNVTCFINEYGEYVVWTLHSPAVPEYGDWAFVELVYQANNSIPQVTFVRQLTIPERNKINRQYMVWGGKLDGVSWAMVYGTPDTFGEETGKYDVVTRSSSTRSVGV